MYNIFSFIYEEFISCFKIIKFFKNAIRHRYFEDDWYDEE